MCDKCKELEARIEHCRKFLADSLDPLTRERIEQMLEGLQSAQREQAAICLP
jgi:hypothetical protein